MKIAKILVSHRIPENQRKITYPSTRAACRGYGKKGSHWRQIPVLIPYNPNFLDKPEIILLGALTGYGAVRIEFLPETAEGDPDNLGLPRYTAEDYTIPLHRWLRKQVERWRLGETIENYGFIYHRPPATHARVVYTHAHELNPTDHPSHNWREWVEL